MESAGTTLATYDSYVGGAPTNSNHQPELPQDERYGMDLGSTYLNCLLRPVSNPHAGVLPVTSRSYAQHEFLDGNSAHMDLSILDSETHSDGRIVEGVRSSSGVEARGNDTTLFGGLVLEQNAMESGAALSSQSDDRSWKKPRTNGHGSGDEVAGKKIRGRPRVDTADETAADRRRTQIRLAQRAYRLRKETTISTLKERLSELQSSIEGVSRSFLKFNDNAISSGIAQTRPDLARDLKETAEQVLKLARTANLDYESGPDEGMEESSGYDRDGSVRSKSKTPTHRGTAKRPNRTTPTPEKSQPDPRGYRVVRGEQALNENGKRPIGPASSPVPRHRGGRDASGSPASTAPVQSLQQYRAEVPSLDQYPYAFESQQVAPPMPWTLSFQETTFARRLHRAAAERGYYLLLSPNSPPSEVTRVFDFCFTFSNRDEILRRLQGILMRSNKESLEYLQSPLLHIGGAGLRYPRKYALGDRERVTDLTTPVRSVGPMALAITDGMKEKGVTPEAMIDQIGLHGEWFDSNDVEGYLREKGVVLAGDSSFADIEVASLDTLDTASTATPPSPIFSGSNSSDTTDTNGRSSPSERPAPYNHNSGDQGFGLPNGMLFAETAIPFDTNAISSDDWYFNPHLEKPLQHSSDDTYTSEDTKDPYGFGAYMRTSPHILNNSKAANVEEHSSSRRKKVVSIDVAVLVEELVRRGVCLGRSPGFRKKDVDEAIRIATMSTF